MNKIGVQAAMLSGLGELLRDHGFALSKKQKCLLRKIAGGDQRIAVPVMDYNPVFVVTVKAKTRFDAVQDLIEASEGGPLSPDSHTVNTGLEYFCSEQRAEKRFDIESDDDLTRTLEELRPLVLHRMLPLLNQWRDLRTMEKTINGPCETYWHVQYPARGQVGVTTAFLADPDRFEDVVKQYQDEMATIKVVPSYVKYVNDTISYLRNRQ